MAATNGTDETGLGPGCQLMQKGEHRLVGDQFRNETAFRPLRGMGGPDFERGCSAHLCTPAPGGDAMSRNRTLSLVFESNAFSPCLRGRSFGDDLIHGDIVRLRVNRCNSGAFETYADGSRPPRRCKCAVIVSTAVPEPIILSIKAYHRH
jgi:hypothetical protein